MMNRKITAIVVTILAVAASNLCAHRCYNDNGKRVRCHRVGHVARRTGEFVGDTTKGAGETAANILTLGGYSRAKEKRQERENEEDEEIEDENEMEDEEETRD